MLASSDRRAASTSSPSENPHAESHPVRSVHPGGEPASAVKTVHPGRTAMKRPQLSTTSSRWGEIRSAGACLASSTFTGYVLINHRNDWPVRSTRFGSVDIRQHLQVGARSGGFPIRARASGDPPAATTAATTAATIQAANSSSTSNGRAPCGLHVRCRPVVGCQQTLNISVFPPDDIAGAVIDRRAMSPRSISPDQGDNRK